MQEFKTTKENNIMLRVSGVNSNQKAQKQTNFDKRLKPVNNKISFGTRYLQPSTTQKLQNLLLNMNSQTIHTTGEYFSHENILAGLKTKFGILVNLPSILRPVKRINIDSVSMSIKKLIFAINPKNGEVLQLNKPKGLTWKKFNEKVEGFVDELQSNFDNKEVVEKKVIEVIKPNQGVIEKLREAQSLSEVIEHLKTVGFNLNGLKKS